MTKKTSFKSNNKDKILYTLVRAGDNLVNIGVSVNYIEWKENGSFAKLYRKPKVGRSCVLNIENAPNYCWMTTVITEITKNINNCIEFKTLNSTYTLTW